MPLVRILKDFQAVEGWVVGQIVGMTNHEQLVREGKVEVVPDDTPETSPADVPTPETVPSESVVDGSSVQETEDTSTPEQTSNPEETEPVSQQTKIETPSTVSTETDSGVTAEGSETE